MEPLDEAAAISWERHREILAAIRVHLRGSYRCDVGVNGDAPMPLLTAELRRRLPSLYATEEKTDPTVQAKFFTSWTNWTWYAIEFDGEDLFFGLVDGHELEMGYFSLSELESIRGPEGLKIERDRHFEPLSLSRIRQSIERGRAALHRHNRER